MAFLNSPEYSITYSDYAGINFASSNPYSITYSADFDQENAANSAPYSITYVGDYLPITSVGTDSIGQHCAVMKAVGNDAGGSLHFAARTSGPYSQGDGAIFRSGVCRQGNDGDTPLFLHEANLFRRLESVDIRHMGIHENKIDFVVGK